VTPAAKASVVPLTLLVLMFDASPSLADCSTEQSRAAEAVADDLPNWGSVYDAYSRFGVCDDGAIAEGFSDSIARLLTKQWNSLIALDRLATAHPGFRRFVLRHIDSLMSPDQARLIVQNSRRHCPQGSGELCSAIAEQISVASKG
jgi:hypothetical protein